MHSTLRARAAAVAAVTMIAANSSAEEAEADAKSDAKSAIVDFLLQTEIEGWVAASYFYNFNDPDDQTGGNAAIGNPYHADANSFQFDEAVLVVDNAASKESPAGFHFEVFYGATASANGSSNGNGNDFWIPAANVAYRLPIGPTITAGKFGTTIGYEVAGAPLNVNITRGFVYNLFQPIDHVGVKVSNEYDSGLSWTLAAVNGFGADQPDLDDSKGFLWGLGFGSGMFSSSFNGIVVFPASGTTYVLDLILEAKPTDQLLLWLNADYYNTESGSDSPWGVGIALGGRFAITDRIGIGARGEWGRGEGDGTVANPLTNLDGDICLYSATLTGDWSLTKNLTWKAEFQWQGARGTNEEIFPKENYMTDNQIILGTQIYYAF